MHAAYYSHRTSFIRIIITKYYLFEYNTHVESSNQMLVPTTCWLSRSKEPKVCIVWLAEVWIIRISILKCGNMPWTSIYHVIKNKKQRMISSDKNTSDDIIVGKDDGFVIRRCNVY